MDTRESIVGCREAFVVLSCRVTAHFDQQLDDLRPQEGQTSSPFVRRTRQLT